MLIVLALFIYLWNFRRKREIPKWLLVVLVLSGPMAMMSIEAGWIFACTGRQPWTIYRMLSTADSVTTSTNLGPLFASFAVVYAILGIAVVSVLLYYFKRNTVQDDIYRAEQKGLPLYGSNS